MLWLVNVIFIIKKLLYWLISWLNHFSALIVDPWNCNYLYLYLRGCKRLYELIELAHSGGLRIHSYLRTWKASKGLFMMGQNFEWWFFCSETLIFWEDLLFFFDTILLKLLLCFLLQQYHHKERALPVLIHLMIYPNSNNNICKY